MKKLDFVLQVFGFTVVGFLMLYALCIEEGIALLYFGMLYLGLYHIGHYFLNLIYTMARPNEGKEYMAWYPIMVVAYFVMWRITAEFYYNETYFLLMAAMALIIGGYYFHEVHKTTFEFDIKVNV